MRNLAVTFVLLIAIMVSGTQCMRLQKKYCNARKWGCINGFQVCPFEMRKLNLPCTPELAQWYRE